MLPEWPQYITKITPVDLINILDKKTVRQLSKKSKLYLYDLLYLCAVLIWKYPHVE